jgi:hypothetical protein
MDHYGTRFITQSIFRPPSREPERAALIFLPFAIALPQFAPFTPENDARNTLGRL